MHFSARKFLQAGAVKGLTTIILGPFGHSHNDHFFSAET